jgi:predicted negative regulator of RcsB-dependent stress response
MELREIILLAGGISLGFGLGLMVYVVHRFRETRTRRFFRTASNRYDKILERANQQQAHMEATVEKLTELKQQYVLDKK